LVWREKYEKSKREKKKKKEKKIRTSEPPSARWMALISSLSHWILRRSSRGTALTWSTFSTASKEVVHLDFFFSPVDLENAALRGEKKEKKKKLRQNQMNHFPPRGRALQFWLSSRLQLVP
jgi:hypothetical protein